MMNNTSQLVDFVFAAEFDIDRGSTLRHCFPRPPAPSSSRAVDAAGRTQSGESCDLNTAAFGGVSESFIAEHMLPEGAHNRSDDWTCFLLNRSAPPVTSTRWLSGCLPPSYLIALDCFIAKAEAEPRAAAAAAVDDVDGDDDDERNATLPLPLPSDWRPQCGTVNGVDCIWALKGNHVRGEQSNGTGLTLTASTRSKVGSTADEQSAASSVTFSLHLPTRVEELCYHVLNSLECAFVCSSSTSDAPHSATGAVPQWFRLTFEEPAGREEFENFLEHHFGRPPSPPRYYCFNVVSNRSVASVRRGAVVRALCVASRYPFFHVLKPLLRLALDDFFVDASVNVLVALHESCNKINLQALPDLGAVDRQLLRRSIGDPLSGLTQSQLRNFVESTSVARFQTSAFWPPILSSADDDHEQRERIVVPCHVPLVMEVDEIGGASAELLLNIFGADTMQIFNAVLCEKRLLFISKTAPAGDLCAAVLSACSLLSPVVKGVAERCFPYATLNDLTWLEHPGYIAGVTNPVFRGREAWWDVLCELDTGEIVKSSIPSAVEKEQQDRAKQLMMQEQVVRQASSSGGKAGWSAPIRRMKPSRAPRGEKHMPQHGGQDQTKSQQPNSTLVTGSETPAQSTAMAAMTMVGNTIGGLDLGLRDDALHLVARGVSSATSFGEYHIDHANATVDMRTWLRCSRAAAPTTSNPFVSRQSSSEQAHHSHPNPTTIPRRMSTAADTAAQAANALLLAPEAVTAAAEQNADVAFVSRVLDGSAAGFGSEWVRTQFRDLTQQIASSAFAECSPRVVHSHRDDVEVSCRCPCACCVLWRQPIPPSENAARAAVASVVATAWSGAGEGVACTAGPRVQRWRSTRSFLQTVPIEMCEFRWYHARSTLQSQSGTNAGTGAKLHLTHSGVRGAWKWGLGRGVDVRSVVKRLQKNEPVAREHMIEFYRALVELFVTEGDLKHLLVLLPVSQGGLEVVARGLMDSSSTIRQCTVTVLQRLEAFKSTRAAVSRLNLFYASMYHRQLRS